MLAHLLLVSDQSLRQVFAHVKDRRPNASPNAGVSCVLRACAQAAFATFRHRSLDTSASPPPRALSAFMQQLVDFEKEYSID